MDFAYTSAQQELKARAAAYADLLMGYEDEAEQAGGPLPKETVDKLTTAAIDAGMFGINMPAEWGGAGLTLLEQVIVEEEFGRATNCLWDIPWRPANVLALASEEQRERYLLPILRGERFDAFATTERDARRRRLADQRREVVRHMWRRRGLPAGTGECAARQRIHPVLRRERHA